MLYTLYISKIVYGHFFENWLLDTYQHITDIKLFFYILYVPNTVSSAFHVLNSVFQPQYSLPTCILIH